jgi:hypothetical protein
MTYFTAEPDLVVPRPRWLMGVTEPWLDAWDWEWETYHIMSEGVSSSLSCIPCSYQNFVQTAQSSVHTASNK